MSKKCNHEWMLINTLDTDEGRVDVFECIWCPDRKVEQRGD